MGSILTLSDYFMGRDLTHGSELHAALQANACVIVTSVNELLRMIGVLDVRVNSGWRPHSINAAIPNASARSRHLTCEAIDLGDADGMIDAWCLRNLDRLEALGLWLEHPDATPGWCHVQTVPPRSGRRVFMP
jgi:hypothetical protein